MAKITWKSLDEIEKEREKNKQISNSLLLEKEIIQEQIDTLALQILDLMGV